MHYYRMSSRRVTTEFNTIKNWQSLRRDHSAFLYYALAGITDEQKSIAAELGYDEDDFKSEFASSVTTADVFMLSFWADPDIPVYRHRPTGLEVPYCIVGAGKDNFISTGSDPLIDRLNTNDIQRERVGVLRSGEWDYRAELPEAEMTERYRWIVSQIPRTTKVVMTLANEKWPPYFDNGGLHGDHVIYNRAVRRAVSGLKNVLLIDPAEFIAGKDDLLDVNHFRRETYFSIYQHVILRLSQASAANPPPLGKGTWAHRLRSVFPRSTSGDSVAVAE